MTVKNENIIEIIPPLKIDIDTSIKNKTLIECNLLCDINFHYSTGNVSYIFDKSSKVKFNYLRDNSTLSDVIFNDTPYTLKYFYIGKRRHTSFPINNDSIIKGEVTLFHEGKNDDLIVSIPLKYSKSINDSQDFFSQFLSVQVGKENITGAIKETSIETSNDWTFQNALPTNKSYYVYSDDKNNIRTIVFKTPIDIDKDNLIKAKEMQYESIPQEREKLITEYIYFQNYNTDNNNIPSARSSNAPVTINDLNDESSETELARTDNQQYRCKPSNLFSVNHLDIDPHETCELRDEALYNDSPKEWQGIEGNESQLEVFFVSLLLLLLAFTFFKILPTKFRIFKICLKLVSCILWCPIHFSYIWLGQAITIILFFVIFLLKYFKECYEKLKWKFQNRKQKKSEEEVNFDQQQNMNGGAPHIQQYGGVEYEGMVYKFYLYLPLNLIKKLENDSVTIDDKYRRQLLEFQSHNYTLDNTSTNDVSADEINNMKKTDVTLRHMILKSMYEYLLNNSTKLEEFDTNFEYSDLLGYDLNIIKYKEWFKSDPDNPFHKNVEDLDKYIKKEQDYHRYYIHQVIFNIMAREIKIMKTIQITDRNDIAYIYLNGSNKSIVVNHYFKNTEFCKMNANILENPDTIDFYYEVILNFYKVIIKNKIIRYTYRITGSITFDEYVIDTDTILNIKDEYKTHFDKPKTELGMFKKVFINIIIEIENRINRYNLYELYSKLQNGQNVQNGQNGQNAQNTQNAQNELCEYLIKANENKNIHSNEHATKIWEEIESRYNDNLLTPDEREVYHNMKKMYKDKIDSNANFCDSYSMAYRDFVLQITNGLYVADPKYNSYKLICMLITMWILIFGFLFIFGFPVRSKNKEGKLSNVEFSDGDNICRNEIRTLGNGYRIDSCYRSINLKKYIKDSKIREKFKKKYIRLRKSEKNAYDSCNIAFQDIHKNIDMKQNYKLQYHKNDKVINVLEIKSCKFFNDFFAEKLKRPEHTAVLNIY